MSGPRTRRFRPDAPLRGVVRAVIVAGLLLSVTAVSAQDRPVPDEPGRLAMKTARARAGRIDTDENVWRARYSAAVPIARVVPNEPAERVATRLGSAFGRAFPEDQLEVDGDTRIGPIRHLRYRQVFDGIPVLDRYVTAAVNRAGEVTFAMNGFAYGLEAHRPVTTPTLDAEAARLRARARLEGWGGRIGPADLVVVPGDTPRLAYALYAWPDGPPAEWRVLVDAATGDVFSLEDMTVTRRERPTAEPAGYGIPSLAPAAPWSKTAGITVDGAGAVFDPDPLATAGVPYGAPYLDQNDADAPVLNAERIPVSLRDITRDNDGLYRLDGPYITIVGRDQNGANIYNPPAEPTSFGFSYTRANDGFEAVMAYYHLDKSQRYIQSLGFTDLQATPLPVNPQGATVDDSGWIASLRYIFFGTGGVDDAEDAFVLWHEYAHAILEAGAPGLRTTPEGRALHEGWSDYWAASYERQLVLDGEVQRTDWEQAFRWDSGDATIWAARPRWLDFSGTYPESICTAGSNPGSCVVHYDGPIWSTVLMEVHEELGRELIDRLNLLSHRYLTAPVTFADAAEAVVQADIDYYGGAHVDVLVGHFAPRGLVNADDFWPTAAHDPLASVETTGGTLPIEVEAMGISAPIAEVTAVYRFGDGAPSELTLSPVSDTVYRGELPAPSTADSVHYWIRVRDEMDRTVLLPDGAPAQRYGFFVGPDTVPPTIEHEPIVDASIATWPPVFAARVTDGIGVAGAWVDYTVRYPDGTETDAGSFALAAGAGSVWSAALPVPIGSVRHGSTVEYAIRATDAAAAANETRTPAGGTYAFTVVGTGVLRLFQADGPQTGITTTGAWEAGDPRFGVLTSPLGGAVWATAAGGPYADAAELSRLQLPALDLSALDDGAWLVFRHWYDTEHDGGAVVGEQAGDVLWDGGNVKVSTDGGLTWSVAVPEGGYSGTIKSGDGNVLAGQPAFGGYSYAWRQAVVPLPTAADVRIAFEFGTDDSNSDESLEFAGWYLDDVRITTELTVDTVPPFVTDGPDAVAVWPADATIPFVSIQAGDNVGLADAFVDIEWTGSEGTTTGTMRLPMASYDISRFEGRLDVGRQPRAEDSISMRFRIADFAGNETVYPDTKLAPIRIDVMSLAVADLSEAARPSGGWSRRIEGWTVLDDTGSLVLPPTYLSENSTAIVLEVDHHYWFGLEAGGRAELSLDDGATWTSLVPVAAYPAERDGIPVWAGVEPGRRTDRFDLGALAGRTAQVRFSVVGSPSNTNQYWTIERIELVQQTGDDAFQPVDEPVLHANFPDPFDTTTNISVTLPGGKPATLALYDVLGRRIALLMNGEIAGGTHTMTLDGTRLAPGVYLLRLDVAGRTFTERLVRAH